MNQPARKPSSTSRRPIGRRTQKERNEEAERRLLQAALELISEKGSTGMTLAEVGERAGYSRTLPAHHFGNKDGLLLAVADYMQNQMFDEARALPKQPDGLDALLQVVSVYLCPGKELPLAQRALYALRTEAVMGESVLREKMANFYRDCETFVATHLRIGIERGQIRKDINPELQSLIILGALRGTVSQWLLDPKRIDLGQVRDETIAVLKRALVKE